MIIWLTSYPKSGNTWLRFFLTSLIYSKDGKTNLKSMGSIKSYPRPDQFINLINDINNLKQISQNWIKSQIIINLDRKIKFMKTHNVLCSLNNNSFTDAENTIGTIYIVRDPRNVVTSIKHHFQYNTIEEAKDFIINEKTIYGKQNTGQNPIPTIIGSWKSHYNSWKRVKKNFLLIKYENLISKPNTEFKKIKKYLERILNIKIDDKKMSTAINISSFENLKKMEEKEGFIEGIEDKKTGDRLNFFNLGPKNDWKILLKPKIKKEIELEFYKEMKELGYI
tara:strand:+ start:1007 stop:1846 length:840 start_codon:yes stop_codon:yes gene_type:complete